MWTGAPGPRGSGESASGTTTGGSTKDARRPGISSRRQTRTCAGTGRCSPATFPDAVTADGERDFRRLGGQLRLEAQYAVQRRRDEARLRTPPRHVSQFIGALARSGVSSVLDWTEQEWRTFPPLTGSSASQARALAIQARRE